MSTRIRIDEIEEFPIPRYAGTRRHRSRWRPAARWLLPALLLVIGVGLVVTYGLLAPHDPPSSAQEPRAPEKKLSGSDVVTTVTSPPSKAFEIPAPVYDDTELYESVRTDIAKHPLLGKLGLHVQVVKIENGYVTLTALTGGPDLMPRMEKQEFSDFLRDPIRGREDIKALLTLAEAIKKNPSCKGVFWEESPLNRAERLFLAATRSFLKEIVAMEGNRPLTTEADVLRVVSSPRTAAYIAASTMGYPPEWLVAFEKGLKEFPSRERKWTELNAALLDGKTAEAIEHAKALAEDTPDAVKVAGDETLLLKLKGDWRKIAEAIRMSLSANLTRVQAVKTLLSTPTRSAFAGRQERQHATGIGTLLTERLLRNFVVQQEEDPGVYFTVLLHKLENDGRFQGWLTSVRWDEPFLAYPLLLVNHLFLPVEGTWDISFGSLSVRSRPADPSEVLVREEDKDVTLNLTLRQQPGTRVYREEASRTTLEVLERETDPALLKRVAESPKKVRIRCGGTEVEATSVVYVCSAYALKGEPWKEIVATACESIDSLPDGTLFQVLYGDLPRTVDQGTLLRAEAATKARAREHLVNATRQEHLVNATRGFLYRLCEHAASMQPDMIFLLTNDRSDSWSREYMERFVSKRIPVHVLFWEFPGDMSVGNLYGATFYEHYARGFVRTITEQSRGSFSTVSSTPTTYFWGWGVGPIVEVWSYGSSNRPYLDETGRLIYADADEVVILKARVGYPDPNTLSDWTTEEFPRKRISGFRVLHRVPKETVPEAVWKYLPEGSFD